MNNIKSGFCECYTWAPRGGLVTAHDAYSCICCFELQRRISEYGIIPLLNDMPSTSPRSKSKWLRVLVFFSTINWSRQCEGWSGLNLRPYESFLLPAILWMFWSGQSTSRYSASLVYQLQLRVQPISWKRGHELLIGLDSLAVSADH